MTMPLHLQTLTRRVDLTRLYPPFRELWVMAIDRAHGRGADYFGISGWRDADTEQRDLYALGRKQLDDGTWIVTDAQKIVTNAQPGMSAHNYGVAGDVCRDANVDRAGLQPTWNKDDYEVYASECAAVGLEAGLRWIGFPEGPHAQLPLKKYGLSVATLKRRFEQGGIPNVWDLLNQFDWGTP